jgi:hemerythrin
MSRINWDPSFSLHIAIIDEQHKKFVETINLLYEAIQNNAPPDRIDAVFYRLNEYATYHFMTEEKYFDEFGYPDAQIHKDEHQKFKEKIIIFQQDIKTNNKAVPMDLVDFLESWLENHLITMDKKYVTFFHEHGLY